MKANLMRPGFKLKTKVLPKLTSAAAAASAKKNGENANSGATSLLLGSTAVNIMLAGPLQQILGIIKSTQILLHLLLINVATPASASIFFSQIMSLITLQFWDMDDFFDTLFQLREDDEPLNDQFYTMGYESIYVYKNLGTVVLGILVPIVMWFAIYLIIGYLFPQYEVFKQKVTDILFWDQTF